MISLDGWINLYKEPGLTSAYALNCLKRILGKVKMGHAGTLDPLAYGVLPVALGKATKTIPYLINQFKTYRFKAVWGEQRDTDDKEGKITHTSLKRPSVSCINSILTQFAGDYIQQPPVYSAKKIQGKRACDRMRLGENVILETNKVYIQSLRIIGHLQNDYTQFEMICGKGTYVRSVVHHMGSLLGCYAYADDINRTQVGVFDINNAITIEKLAEMEKISIVEKLVMPLEVALDDIPAALLTWEQVSRIKLGQGVKYEKDDVVIHGLHQQTYVCVNPNQKAIAIALLKDHVLYPSRVFEN